MTFYLAFLLQLRRLVAIVPPGFRNAAEVAWFGGRAAEQIPIGDPVRPFVPVRNPISPGANDAVENLADDGGAFGREGVEIDRFENESDVPGGLQSSPVVHDGTTRKKTAPPKLMDLAGLSSLLSKKGFGAKNVLDTYQKMYEAQVVSYPRTEDKFISIEQFNELLPLVDTIAGVVGVAPAALSHRRPRTSHVKSGGAHGANRPGPNVPPSLAAVEKAYGELGREIYELLAKNYLTMLAPDYEYDQHRGHVEQAGFAVLKSPDIPSILVETAFISNPDEEKRLNDEDYQNKLAGAILNGINRYFAQNPALSRQKYAQQEF